MAIIVQLLARNGKVASQIKLEKNVVQLGRGFDNDVIIDDPHVCAEHAQIQVSEDGILSISDLGSINRVYDKQKQPVGLYKTFNSGAIFYLGKQKIQVFDSAHPVAETVAMTWYENVADWFSTKRTVFLLYLVTLLLTGFSQYFTTTVEFEAKQLVEPLIVTSLAMLAWPIFWSVIALFYRHEARFWAHLSTFLSIMLIGELASMLARVVGFNAGGASGYQLELLFGFILSVVAIRFSLYLFNQKSGFRPIFTSATLTVALYGTMLGAWHAKQPDFSQYPDYAANVLPSLFLFDSGKPIDDYLAGSQTIFDMAQTEAKKDLK
ncbi:hypothetical protein C2869_12440 [Saccharobesus litoralis]|uniref:FHA domain-containing protein n=1 Tax=Saccharobesus litoralis TaxID=2172099 RepID=A0A2S0VSN2_9ALTE|nr:FHA domain-containing protein [Saccharobesus litoralis]AWB67193.1 hypothetical protein C2869_12440 [Saccharobesus litoralis]